MSLLKFWPTEDDCLACIKIEAENPSDAVFLAVHQEIRLSRKSFSSEASSAELKTQSDFLKEFLKDDGSGRVIFPILGVSGIGKSHLVRWLDVQLRQRGDRDKRHVIRIPKSSSLKSVLGLILKGLEGPRYEQIRKHLQSARDQMDPINAIQRVRAELLTLIERNYTVASERQAKARLSGEKIGHNDTLWLKHGDRRKLPALLNDPSTQRLFIKGTSQRPGIISELARHVTKDTSESERPRRQFESLDFVVPKELESDISKANQDAGFYLNTLLLQTNPKPLEEAVGLLNSIVDDAIAPLAKPQNTSLSKLFYEVRRQLLSDERELVLLVEDFAVLAGVQKALLDAIIMEGVVGGKQEACTIRTALAVTDGYFGNLEGVKTRAVHGWWIESGEKDKEGEIENRIGDFVATYVNAARLGVIRLDAFYSNAENAAKKVPNGIESIGAEDDESSLLNGFGKSASGYSMFPFNQSAIRTIAHWKLKDAKGHLRFNPRSIISEVILPVLKDYRSEFERNAFPPESFLGYSQNRINPDLNWEIRNLVSDLVKRIKYLYLFEFWGDKPETIAKAKVPLAVFKAFGLEPLDKNAALVNPIVLEPITTEGQRTSLIGNGEKQIASEITELSKQEVDQEPTPVRDFLVQINTWRERGTLGQSEANRIRGWINTHILNSVNWEAELLSPVAPTTNTYARRIYLPNAKGNLPDLDKAFLVVATDVEFTTDFEIANRVFKAIRAMIRYDHYNGWNYKSADSDYIELMNFVEPYLSQAVKWVRLHYKNIEGNPVPALAQSLLWQARALNVDFAHRKDDVNQLNAIFATPPLINERDNDDHWNSFINSMNDRRKLLIDELVDRIAAFQGKGNIPRAIDATQLLETIQDFRQKWIVSVEFPKPSGADESDPLKQIYDHIAMLKRNGMSKIENRRTCITEQSKQIIAELGTDYEKNELICDLLKVCDFSDKHGLKGDVTVAQVRKLAEDFRNAKAKEVGEQVEAITNGDDLGNRMTAIARLDIKTHAFLVQFTDTCAKFLKERSGKAEGQIISWGDDVVKTAKQSVDEILAELELEVATGTNLESDS